MKKYLWIILSAVCFMLFGLAYLDSNIEKLYALKADYFYKNNKIANALTNYEQAFNLGYNNSDARNTYVETLIGMPLTVETQEKLAKFLKLPVNDSAKYKAELFFYDLRFNIRKDYPDNYISQTSYNQKLLRWNNSPITYYCYNTEKAPEYFIDSINQAFNTWENASEGIVKFELSKKDPNIVIRFNSKQPAAKGNEKYIVAFTQPVFSNNTLKNMVIDIYEKDSSGEYFSENQIYNNALHEIGHALGIMGHSNYRKNVMYISTDSDAITNDLRINLTAADINTLKLLYDTKPDITNKTEPTGKYIPFTVLGDDEDVANAKIREARMYIQKSPHLPTGYIDLAEAYIALNDYTKAVKALNKALELSDSKEMINMVYYNLAVSYYLMKDYEQAKTYLKKSGKTKESEAAALLLAEIELAIGKKNEAIGIYEDLILKNPKNIEFVIALTNIYVRDKQYIKARAVLKDFITKNPDEKVNPKLSPYGILKAFL